jgi:hypothetical protein
MGVRKCHIEAWTRDNTPEQGSELLLLVLFSRIPPTIITQKAQSDMHLLQQQKLVYCLAVTVEGGHR